jgi:hypothetical protein
MTSITDLSSEQLRRAVSIKEQIDRLQKELQSVLGGGATAPKKGGMSAGRARIAAAAKARWAKVKGQMTVPSKPASKGKKTMSAATRAKLAAAAKARWAKIKAAK